MKCVKRRVNIILGHISHTSRAVVVYGPPQGLIGESAIPGIAGFVTSAVGELPNVDVLSANEYIIAR